LPADGKIRNAMEFHTSVPKRQLRKARGFQPLGV
jgi:hypothetical protein